FSDCDDMRRINDNGVLNQTWLKWRVRDVGRGRHALFTGVDLPFVAFRDTRESHRVNSGLIALNLDSQKVTMTVEPHGAKRIVLVHVEISRREIQISSKQEAAEQEANKSHLCEKDKEAWQPPAREAWEPL